VKSVFGFFSRFTFHVSLLFWALGLNLLAGETPPALAVGPYLLGLGPDQVAVCWRTADPSTGTVEYFVRADERREEKSAEAASGHRMVLKNLPPGTECRYRVLVGDQAMPFLRFTAAPAKATPFRFAAYGDSGGNAAEHERIAKAIHSHRPAFVVHTGDFVPQGDTGRGFPAEFFVPARSLIGECPLIPAPGDNDRRAMDAYAGYFGLPKDRAWFTWTYGDLQLFVLNSNEPLAPGSAQGRWLAEALASSRSRWKIAALHHPLYSSGPHGSQHGVRRGVLPLFLQHGVDLVLSGHDHDYERLHPVAAGPDPSANAFVEIVSGGGGQQLHPVIPQPWAAHAESRHHFCLFEVDGDEIRGTAYGDAGEPFDRFVLSKKEGRREFGKALPCEEVEFIANAQRTGKFWFPPLGSRAASKRFELHIVNPFGRELQGDIAWEVRNKVWTVEPATQAVRLAPHGEVKLAITARYTPQAGAGPEPVPQVTFSSGGLRTTVPGLLVQSEGGEKSQRQ